MSIEFERRLDALEAAQSRTDRTLAQVLQRIDASQGETARTWQAIETAKREGAELTARVDRLEGAFDAQWSLLRRMELEALESRKDMHLGFRELRDGLAAIGARLGTPATDPS